MVNMNVFRVLADVSHTASKCILIWAIHSNKSAEGRTWSLPSVSCTDDHRCILDHPTTLHRCLRDSIPRPILGASDSLTLELHLEKLLHMVLDIHHSSDDTGLCTNSREGEGMENRRIRKWRIVDGRPIRHYDIQRMEGV